MTRTTVLIVGLVAAAVWIAGFVIDSRLAMTGYLAGFVIVISLGLGVLLQTMISYLTGSVWFVLLRQYAWAVVACIPPLALGVLPLLAGMRQIYPWTMPGVTHSRWLGAPWVAMRSLLYVGIWAWFAWRMRRVATTTELEADDMVRSARLLRRLSTSGAIVVGLTLTFAAIDWIMSIDPHWISTIFGVYIFAGCYLAGLALLSLMACLGPARSPLARAITEEHRAALATMLFMASMLWAYMAFSQLLVIWMGNVPADAGWYAVRTRNGWLWVVVAAAALRFGLPFPLLLSRRVKRSRTMLGAIAVMVLVGHALDMYWLVAPGVGGWRSALWQCAAASIALASIAGYLAGNWWRRLNALPLTDPDLEAGMAYRR